MIIANTPYLPPSHKENIYFHGILGILRKCPVIGLAALGRRLTTSKLALAANELASLALSPC